MNNSSQEETYTITLNDDNMNVEPYTVNISSSVWTELTIDSLPALTTTDIVTLTGTPYGAGSISIGNIETIDIGSFNGFFKEEFNGRFPDWDRVQEMCKKYPGLEIAYRKFKEVYKMVKEDFDGKERERRGKSY